MNSVDVRVPRFRVPAVVALITLALAGGAPAASGPGAVTPGDALEFRVLDRLNVVRQENGIRPLRLNRRLSVAAETHSLEMVSAGYFGHESANGTAFWRRIQRYYRPRAPTPWIVGENLLWSTGGLSAQRAVELWLNSPGHRAVLLSRRFREIGLSAITATGAPGVYGGKLVTVLTADFGTR